MKKVTLLLDPTEDDAVKTENGPKVPNVWVSRLWAFHLKISSVFFFYRGEDVECVLVGLKMNPMTFGHRERKMHFFVLWSLKRGNNLVQT